MRAGVCMEGNMRMWEEGVYVCVRARTCFSPPTNVWVANRDLPWM